MFTIHIPIAFASLLAPLLGIAPVNLFLLPLHVVLLELVIDPTCSIVLERQPAEQNVLERPPRNRNEKLLTAKVLLKSTFQGIIIFLASFGTYYTVLTQNPENAPTARAMGLSIILLANLLLVQINSSNTDLAIKSFFYLIKDKIMWIVSLTTIAGLLMILYTPMHSFLKLAPLTLNQFLTVVGIAVISVIWYEAVKIFDFILKRSRYQ